MTDKPHYIKCGPVPVIRDWRSLPVKELTRGEKNLAFVEKYLRVPDGSKVGQLMKVPRFTEEFFISIFDNPHGTRKVIWSAARKNNKTTGIACLALCFIVGPEAKLNTQIVCGAMSREQAGILFKIMSKMIAMSPELIQQVKIVPSGKKIIGLARNVEFSAIAAESATAQGLNVRVGIIDEPGQIKGPESEFVTAISSSQGSHEDAMMIYMSTQAPTDADFFSVLIDDAIKSQDPHTVCHVYAASENCDLMDKEEWKRSNPALGIFRSERDLEEQLKEAQRIPSKENLARLYLLNQRISADSPFVSKDVWLSNGSIPIPLRGKKVYCGLDLSAVSDLTGLVLVGDDGSVEVKAWLPQEGILEKSRNDRVPYDVWARQGFMTLTPGKAVQYEWVAHELKRVFSEYEVQQINFDRWNMKFLKPWLEKAGFTPEEMAKFKDFGQGFGSMSPALRSLETSLLDGSLKHGNNPVLTMCMGNCVVEMDAAGGRKFTKKKSTGRIDLAVALAMAEDARAAHAKNPDGEWSLHL